MANLQMTYILDRSKDEKISKVHWHVFGDNPLTKKVSLVIQKMWNGQADNSPDGIIKMIVTSETLRLKLTHSQIEALRKELQDNIHVQKINICYGDCS